MKTSRAGRTEANIIHMGKWPYRPRGWMTQPRAEELDTLRPSGTESFCEKKQLVRTWDQMARETRGSGKSGSWGRKLVEVLKDLLPWTFALLLATSLSPLCVFSFLIL